MTIRIDRGRLMDDHGRTLIFRGANLGGSSKVPFTPDGSTYRREGFFEHRAVSFVGRPFPLEQADEHLGRLAAWGLSLIRLITTWEAIEHAGPGLYDEAYLDYLEQVVARAGEHGLTVFVDVHQDVWSRFSGGDGAPGWTFEAAGLDITQFQATGAAIVHNVQGDPFPRMIWPTNGWKLAAATMYTLFFGGDDFAPGLKVNGEGIQGYLQRHYLAAVGQLARRMRRFPHVLGYDAFNEPMPGFIGNKTLHRPASPLTQGQRPSPLEMMALGIGIPQWVEHWAWELAPRPLGRWVVDPRGANAWLGGECLWRNEGVWDVAADGRPQLLRPQHFAVARGRAVEFSRDYWRPFCNRFAAALRQEHPEALVFVQPEYGGVGPAWGDDDAPGIVYAPHWYDLVTLFIKRYVPGLGLDLTRRGPVFGIGPVERQFANELREHVRHGREAMRGAPTVVGEFGIPFDLNGRSALRTGDFSVAERALDRSYRAIEDALISSTIWNYTADNSNRYGDRWNDEDLSIFSPDQRSNPADLNSGGRALRSAVRPYAAATAGEPLRMRFDTTTRAFVFRFRHDPAIQAPTAIFLPEYHYPGGCRVWVSDGSYELDLAARRLYYTPATPGGEHEIRIRPLS